MTANQASSVKWQNTAISLSVQLVKVRSPGNKEETEVVVGETVVNVEAGAGVVGDSYHQGVYHFWNINFIR